MKFLAAAACIFQLPNPQSLLDPLRVSACTSSYSSYTWFVYHREDAELRWALVSTPAAILIARGIITIEKKTEV